MSDSEYPKPVTLRSFSSGEAPSAPLSEETPALCKALVMITVSLQREGASLAISTISHHLKTWRISYLESLPSKSKLGKCNVKPKNQRLKHQRTCKILLIVFMNEEKGICIEICSKRDRIKRGEEII